MGRRKRKAKSREATPQNWKEEKNIRRSLETAQGKHDESQTLKEGDPVRKAAKTLRERGRRRINIRKQRQQETSRSNAPGGKREGLRKTGQGGGEGRSKEHQRRGKEHSHEGGKTEDRSQ